MARKLLRLTAGGIMRNIYKYLAILTVLAAGTLALSNTALAARCHVEYADPNDYGEHYSEDMFYAGDIDGVTKLLLFPYFVTPATAPLQAKTTCDNGQAYCAVIDGLAYPTFIPDRAIRAILHKAAAGDCDATFNGKIVSWIIFDISLPNIPRLNIRLQAPLELERGAAASELWFNYCNPDEYDEACETIDRITFLTSEDFSNRGNAECLLTLKTGVRVTDTDVATAYGGIPLCIKGDENWLENVSFLTDHDTAMKIYGNNNTIRRSTLQNSIRVETGNGNNISEVEFDFIDFDLVSKPISINAGANDGATPPRLEMKVVEGLEWQSKQRGSLRATLYGGETATFVQDPGNCLMGADDRANMMTMTDEFIAECNTGTPQTPKCYYIEADMGRGYSGIELYKAYALHDSWPIRLLGCSNASNRGKIQAIVRQDYIPDYSLRATARKGNSTSEFSENLRLIDATQIETPPPPARNSGGGGGGYRVVCSNGWAGLSCRIEQMTRELNNQFRETAERIEETLRTLRDAAENPPPDNPPPPEDVDCPEGEESNDAGDCVVVDRPAGEDPSDEDGIIDDDQEDDEPLTCPEGEVASGYGDCAPAIVENASTGKSKKWGCSLADSGEPSSLLPYLIFCAVITVIRLRKRTITLPH